MPLERTEMTNGGGQQATKTPGLWEEGSTLGQRRGQGTVDVNYSLTRRAEVAADALPQRIQQAAWVGWLILVLAPLLPPGTTP